MSSPLIDLPPRPWEAGVRASEPSDHRDLGVERPWDRAAQASSRALEATLARDEREYFDVLRAAARGLREVAHHLESDDATTRERARVGAVAHLFYALGALASRGLVLHRALPSTPEVSLLVAAEDACRSLGQELDRFVTRLGEGRPTLVDVARLVDRVEECWDQVSR